MYDQNGAYDLRVPPFVTLEKRKNSGVHDEGEPQNQIDQNGDIDYVLESLNVS